MSKTILTLAAGAATALALALPGGAAAAPVCNTTDTPTHDVRVCADTAPVSAWVDLCLDWSFPCQTVGVGPFPVAKD